MSGQSKRRMVRRHDRVYWYSNGKHLLIALVVGQYDYPTHDHITIGGVYAP